MPTPFELNLRHMRAVPEIAVRGSVAAAAAAAALSQPALTQGLAKIERQLGVPLFERRPDGMAVTTAGAAFAERIDAAMTRLALGIRAAGRGGGGFARPLALATSAQLRAFLAVADAGGFAQAARAADWSQPAVHRAVRDLEQLIGVVLVERRGRGAVLTASGRQLARAVRLAAAEIDAGIAAASPVAARRGRLTVGAMPLSRARLLPAAIAATVRDLPGVTIDVVEGSWRELAEPLRDGFLDLTVGALRSDADAADLQQEALVEDRLAIVCRAGHPLAGAGAAGVAALAAYPWIVGRPDAPGRRQWEALFAGADLPAAPVECGSVMTIRGILVDSDCLTLLSAHQVGLEVQAGVLAIIPTDSGPMTRTIGMTTRAGWRLTPLQARFADALRIAADTPLIA